jgi:hypothetical protein
VLYKLFQRGTCNRSKFRVQLANLADLVAKVYPKIEAGRVDMHGHDVDNEEEFKLV